MRRTFGAFLLIGLGAGLTTSGCGEAAEEIDEKENCDSCIDDKACSVVLVRHAVQRNRAVVG